MLRLAAVLVGILLSGPSLSHGAGYRALLDFITEGDVETVQALIDAGADVNPKKELFEFGGPYYANGMPLHVAALVGRWGVRQRPPLPVAADMIRVLVKAGADVNDRTPASFYHGRLSQQGFDEGLTPLHLAVLAANVAAIKALLDAGADIEARVIDHNDTGSRTGDRPLHYAIGVDVIKALLDAGADIDAKGFGGSTPLHYRASTGNVPAIKALLDAGADVNARNKRDLTPLALARYHPAIKALLKAGARTQ